MAATVLFCAQAGAATLSDIQVSNGDNQARITFSFMGDPEYAFSQDDKRSVALDIKQTGVIKGLPLQFSGNNLVHSIRSAERRSVPASGGRFNPKRQDPGGEATEWRELYGDLYHQCRCTAAASSSSAGGGEAGGSTCRGAAPFRAGPQSV